MFVEQHMAMPGLMTKNDPSTAMPIKYFFLSKIKLRIQSARNIHDGFLEHLEVVAVREVSATVSWWQEGARTGSSRNWGKHSKNTTCATVKEIIYK